MPLEKKIIETLIDRNKTLAIAESCTGGLLTSRLTDISGSSKCIRLGIIAYSNEAKTKFLNVPKKLIEKYGAVSYETTSLMAKNVKKHFNTDLGVGISGIAGPTGGTKKKPVGLVFIAVSSKYDTLCLECRFKGTRTKIKEQSVKQALELLLEFI